MKFIWSAHNFMPANPSIFTNQFDRFVLKDLAHWNALFMFSTFFVFLEQQEGNIKYEWANKKLTTTHAHSQNTHTKIIHFYEPIRQVRVERLGRAECTVHGLDILRVP